MNKSIKLIGYVTIALSIGAAYWAYQLPDGYWQDILVGIATTFLGLGLGVVIVNHFLSASDKKLAAKPILKLLAPNVGELHNELFIEYGRNVFGKDQFETLGEIYLKHNGNPQAFSPQQRNDLYAAIEKKKAEFSRVYDALHEQLKEVTMILGWSFDSEITAAALTARLNFATFRAINWDGSEATKLSAIETYFDAEASTSAVMHLLVRHLGLKDEEWQTEN